MDGIIYIKKDIGMTSFDVVRKLKRLCSEKKIGHTGTLDPQASGVMIVCLGKCTRLVQDIENTTKSYSVGFELGYKTDTYDLEGKVTDRVQTLNPVEPSKLNNVLTKFIGKIKQVPPMYSALKVEGKRLYELARAGVTLDLKARDVTIYSIDVIDFDGIKGNFNCDVSKGTYIRSLVYDMGEELKTFATMTRLERTKVGDVSIDKCFSLERIEEMIVNNDFSFLISAENYFGYPRLDLVGEDNLKYYKNGNSFNYKCEEGRYSIYYENEFIGLGECVTGRLKSYKYF